MLFGMNAKDMVIGGISVISLGGSVVNFCSNRKLKKRMNQTEAVLQQLGAMPAPTTAPTAPTTPQQPQAQPPVTGQAPQAPQQ